MLQHSDSSLPSTETTQSRRDLNTEPFWSATSAAPIGLAITESQTVGFDTMTVVF